MATISALDAVLEGVVTSDLSVSGTSERGSHSSVVADVGTGARGSGVVGGEGTNSIVEGAVVHIKTGITNGDSETRASEEVGEGLHVGNASLIVPTSMVVLHRGGEHQLNNNDARNGEQTVGSTVHVSTSSHGVDSSDGITHGDSSDREARLAQSVGHLLSKRGGVNLIGRGGKLDRELKRGLSQSNGGIAGVRAHVQEGESVVSLERGVDLNDVQETAAKVGLESRDGSQTGVHQISTLRDIGHTEEGGINGGGVALAQNGLNLSQQSQRGRIAKGEEVGEVEV